MNLSVGGTIFFASALMTIARSGRIVPLRFYDDPSLLTPVGVTIELLRHQSQTTNRPVSEAADQIEEHFLLDGPARFGFELVRGME